MAFGDSGILGAASGPVGIGIGAIGLGLDIFGGIEASQAAKKKYETEQQQAQLEQKLNQTRRETMEFMNRRKQLDIVRQGQVNRSMALSASTNSGSQFSSGLQGAYAGITGQTSSNILGQSIGLQFGEKAFDLEDLISSAKLQEAKYSSDQASAQGISSIGSGLMSFGGSKFFG